MDDGYDLLADDAAEVIARCFHETYEALAPSFGYETREASAKPWADVPDQNKGLMKSVVRTLIMNGVINPGLARREVLIPAGITVNGALIALMQDSDDDPVTAELRIDGPPVP